VLEQVTERLLHARSVLFVTGAGISVGSGLPTYRGVGGLYSDGQLTPSGVPIEDALSHEMCTRSPATTWYVSLWLDEVPSGPRLSAPEAQPK
jgi:NAD-dependent deacetylase